MRTRGAAVQGGLAALGLVAAWATWQREPERAPGEVIIVDAGKSDVQSVRFEDNTTADKPKWVELGMRKDADGPVVWMQLSPSDKVPAREVRGNDGAVKLFERFGPLRATRALGVLAADKLKELGLETPKKKLMVTARGGKRTFLIGQSAFNVSEPYLMDEGDKRVYVLGGGLISDLESAGVRLVDRTLHGFKPNEYDALTITAGGKSREVVQIGREQPVTAKLASKKTPTKTDEMVKNWHDKLWRTYVTDVLGKDEKPTGGAPAPALKVEYFEGGKSRGFIEIGKVAAPPPPAPLNTTPPPAPPAAEIFARSEHTAGWVKLPASADDVLKEADKIAATE
jgi:hypothetical protein